MWLSAFEVFVMRRSYLSVYSVPFLDVLLEVKKVTFPRPIDLLSILVYIRTFPLSCHKSRSTHFVGKL